jgi:Chaperone of endosialidase/Head domain of trimeric autotransporter adhesin
MQKQIGFLFIIGFSTNWAIAQNVGIGTTNPRARLHVADSSVLFTAPATLPANAGNTPVTGPGHRMMWFANKAALRLGRTTGNQSDAAQVGQLSFASGQDNIVTGFASAAFGTENKLSSGYNFAAGYGNETRSVTAAAFGFNNLVKAQHGFAIGLHNDTSDNASPNVAGTFDRLFQIGNGSSGNNRSNAITVLRNGNTGIGTVNPATRLHVADSSVLFTAPATLPANAGNPPVSGAGNRMMWHADKASFRAGGVQSTEWDIENIGQYSFATGLNNRAVGYVSFSAGQNNLSSGFGSTTFGKDNMASEIHSFAGGLAARATGSQSFAFGYDLEARGAYTASFGSKTIAKGSGSFAAGGAVHANGQFSFATGLFNDTTDAVGITGSIPPGGRIFQVGNGVSNSQRSNAFTILYNGRVGIGTTTPAARLHVADSSVVFTSTSFSPDARPPVEGNGGRMMWFASRSAFRAGSAGTTEWDRDSIGVNSFGSGLAPKAIAFNSAAFGFFSQARGFSSFATGEYSIARGQTSIAMGVGNLANAYASMAIGGAESKATGEYAVAIGFRSTASGQYAQAFGHGSIASGISATSLGYATQATNNDALAIGQSTIASGIGSFAAGNLSEAKGTNSMALGYNAIANASYTTALGYSTRANGVYATAIGFSSVADGSNALATGQNTSASGAYSSSFGWATNAKAVGAMAVGVYNDNTDNPNTSTEQSTDRLFQIGNGNSTTRSNAITVLRNGYTGIGVTDPAYNLDISTRMRIRGAPGFSAGLWLNNEANTAIPAFIGMYTDNLVGFYGNGVGWGFVMNTTTGNATLSGSLTQNSDARLKRDIVPLSNSLEAIQQLSGYSYHWKDASNTDEQIGLLAQEIQKVYPQLVKENAQGTLSVNYSGMVPVLLEAIKEQQKQSEKQQLKIDMQQNELEELKKLVQQLLNTKQ